MILIQYNTLINIISIQYIDIQERQANWQSFGETFRKRRAICRKKKKNSENLQRTKWKITNRFRCVTTFAFDEEKKEKQLKIRLNSDWWNEMTEILWPDIRAVPLHWKGRVMVTEELFKCFPSN